MITGVGSGSIRLILLHFQVSCSHEVLNVAETGHREAFLQHLRRHERRETTYLENVQGPSAERDKRVECGHG